jgi:very-short-patch-repair endonuclease
VPTQSTSPGSGQDRDRALYSLLRQQSGVVRRDQLHQLGFPPRTLSRRVAAGQFAAHGNKVLALVGLADDMFHRSLVAGHRTWPRGVLTGPSAVVVHGRQDEPPWDAVDLGLMPWVVHRDHWDGLRVLRACATPPVTTCYGLPVATLEAALLHMLTLLPYQEALALARRSAQVHGAARLLRSLEDAASGDMKSRTGAAQLRLLGAELESGAQSQAESLALHLLQRAGVQGFRVNFGVRSGRRRVVIDIAFPDERLAVEIDGQAWHTSPRRFQSDRARQNRLVAAGWRVLRFTWRDLTETPDAVIRSITDELQR